LKAKQLEIGKHGKQWWSNQRSKSNKAQRQHDELNHVDTEPLVDSLIQMRVRLMELEPKKSSMVPKFFKTPKSFGGFYF